MGKKFWKAAFIRALRTVAQNLAATLPAGFIITSKMIEGLNVETLYVVLGWLATGLLSGLASLLTSIATGLPEVKKEAK